MRRFIETTDVDGRKVLIKVDAIRSVSESNDEPGCFINGNFVVMPYTELRRLIDSDDYHIIHDHSWSKALSYVMNRGSVDHAIKMLGAERAHDFFREIFADPNVDPHELLQGLTR